MTGALQDRMAAAGVSVEFRDDGPDSLGRRLFVLDWTDRVGRRRGQCFKARFEEMAERLLKNIAAEEGR